MMFDDATRAAILEQQSLWIAFFKKCLRVEMRLIERGRQVRQEGKAKLAARYFRAARKIRHAYNISIVRGDELRAAAIWEYFAEESGALPVAID